MGIQILLIAPGVVQVEGKIHLFFFLSLEKFFVCFKPLEFEGPRILMLVVGTINVFILCLVVGKS